MSALAEGLHPWRPGAPSSWVDLDWCDPHDGPLLAADSWRVVDGRVRGLARHLARFTATVAEHRSDADRFAADVVDVLPRTGDWFPRVELRARGDGTHLSLRLRPTPAVGESVVVATGADDPRTRPLVKGPDLDALQALRVAVQPRGAGEAVILDERGVIVEGAYSALLWWRDDVLMRPDDALARIPSVTSAIVIEAAIAAGSAVGSEHARPADLQGCELWAVSALHGLRVATAWVDGPVLSTRPGRAERARGWLDAAAEALPTASKTLYPEQGTPALGG